MTNSTRILKANRDNASDSRVILCDLSERPFSRFAATDFEPLSLPASNPHRAVSRVDTRVQSALTSLHAASEQLHSQRDRWLDQCQTETIRLGVAIAERLLHRTLTTHPEAVIDLVRSALEWSVGADQLSVRLHPADAELVTSAAASLQTEACATIEFVADESLTRGDCVVETPNGQIDARREVLTQRIVDELLMP